jgi:hypothetical protein
LSGFKSKEINKDKEIQVNDSQQSAQQSTTGNTWVGANIGKNRPVESEENIG